LRLSADHPFRRLAQAYVMPARLSGQAGVTIVNLTILKNGRHGDEVQHLDQVCLPRISGGRW
jgi:hypothetical protein